MTVDHISISPLRTADPGIAFVGDTRFSLDQPGSAAWQASNQSTFCTPDECRVHLYSTDLDGPVQGVVLTTAHSLGLEVRAGAFGGALLVSGRKKLSTPAQDALLAIARERSRARVRDDQRDSASAGAPAPVDVRAGGGAVADPPEPDGITAKPDTGGMKDWKQARDALVMPNAETINERTWEQDEYRLDAKRGRNRGSESREQQDRDAEVGVA